MKKLIVGLLFSVLLGSGLVAFSGSTASAVDCPYTGCVKTSTQVNATSPAARNLRVRATVRTAGDARPKGQVKITVTGPGKTRSATRDARSASTVTFSGLKPGRYRVTATYVPAKNSIYKRSQDSTTVRVKARR
ncbi:Ig-like domain repeat protein [Nocardioides sp. 1609]|uniref:Ig-like domain repeat protein n=1 Tax=Nocardioides sp. 1609 TaxID=2508327 RepID=UPI00106FE167|nr:Ig-like domain repeat protein [Nocardioides sp. 1609]